MRNLQRGRKAMVKLHNLLVACALIAALLCSGCFKSKNVVNRIPPTNGKLLKLDGVPYALPRTVIQMQIPVKRTDKAPGEFGRYARCFFSKEVAAGRVMAESKSFSIEQPIFTSRGEPDPDGHFIAKIKGGLFENKTLFLEYNEDGVITKGEATSENTAIDVAIKAARATVSAAASLAKGPAAGGGVRITRTFSQKNELEQARINICRSLVIAEAASLAADRADAAAKKADAAAREAEAMATATPANAAAQAAAASARLGANNARAAADQARLHAEHAERLVAAANRQFLNATQAFTELGDDDLSVNITDTLTDLKNTTGVLINKVVCDAKIVNQQVQLSDAAARPLAGDEAEAARKAASNIDEAIRFTGLVSSAAPFTYDAFHTGCIEQRLDQPQADAFANSYLEAKKQYDRLVLLRERRENLLSTQSTTTNLPADTLKSVLEQADATINTYQSTFFLGTKSEDSWTAKFKFIPGRSFLSISYNTQQTSPALFIFSKTEGLCETPESQSQGVKIKENFKAGKCPLPADKSEAVWLAVTRQMSDDSYLGHMAAANARDESKGERGFYYRIPAMATAVLLKGKLTKAEIDQLETQSKEGQKWRLVDRDTPAPDNPQMPAGAELGRDNIKVAQLGVTASIPASAAGRKTQYTIEFDEKTGAMKNFKLASNALLEKSLVDEASGAVSDIIGAKQARDKAREDAAKKEAEANDPLNQKKRELELLKTENEINAERKKLAESQEGTQP